MSILRVSNIQRMCFHDGPGIRTTIFLKGCSLHCPWCSNPENIDFGLENGFGRDYTSEELFREVLKDKVFWEEDSHTGECGGVTFSGGEPLLQADALFDLLMALKSEGVNIAVETALFVPLESIRRIIEFIDYFIVDVKILMDDTCRTVLGGDIERYLENVEWLHRKKKISVFRIPCCMEYTIESANRKKSIDFLNRYHDIPVQIFKLHDLAESKYRMLGCEMWKPDPVPDGVMEEFLAEINRDGDRAEIIRI